MTRQDEPDDALAQRCRQLSTEIAQHRAAISRAAQERAEILAVLVQRGLTTRAIGALTGISGARVTQVMNLRKWKERTGGGRHEEEKLLRAGLAPVAR